MKILIADDHPIVRQGLRQVLSAEPDMNVVGEAVNGHEALNLLRTVEWDVAILDYAMPGRDGVELVKEIRSQFPRRPILILSVFPEDAHATLALKAGAAGYLNKESAPEELVAAVRKVVAGGRYVSPALAERLALELSPDASRPLHETLSDREYRVMWLLASGKPINLIAEEMCVSPSTISTYRNRILKKLKVESNAALVRYAIKFQLV